MREGSRSVAVDPERAVASICGHLHVVIILYNIFVDLPQHLADGSGQSLRRAHFERPRSCDSRVPPRTVRQRHGDGRYVMRRQSQQTDTIIRDGRARGLQLLFFAPVVDRLRPALFGHQALAEVVAFAPVEDALGLVRLRRLRRVRGDGGPSGGAYGDWRLLGASRRATARTRFASVALPPRSPQASLRS